MKVIERVGQCLLLAALIFGCSTSPCRLGLQQAAGGKMTVNIWNHDGSDQVKVRQYDSERYCLLEIDWQVGPGSKRVAFVEKASMAKIWQADSPYAGQVSTWLVSDKCYQDLIKSFRVISFENARLAAH